jgi:hypothetical protein
LCTNGAERCSRTKPTSAERLLHVTSAKPTPSATVPHHGDKRRAIADSASSHPSSIIGRTIT